MQIKIKRAKDKWHTATHRYTGQDRREAHAMRGLKLNFKNVKLFATEKALINKCYQ